MGGPARILRAGVFRPRVFWDGGNGNTLFATLGVTVEDRDGGTTDGDILQATGAPYIEALNTRRFDGGAVWQRLVGERRVLTGRVALAEQRHDHRFGEFLERDRHHTAFGEIAMRSAAGRHTWVVGGAVEDDAPTALEMCLASRTPSRFLACSLKTMWRSPSGCPSARARGWTITATTACFSVLDSGRCFDSGSGPAACRPAPASSGPSALTEETEAAGLTRLVDPASAEGRNRVEAHPLT